MKRFFYTDPLAAAWMAKHFKMRFDEHMVMLHALSSIGDSEDLSIEHCAPYFIDPDSLHLLDPQVGDFFRWVTDAERPWKDAHHRFVDDGGLRYNVINAKRLIDELNGRILERNGILFHWPQSEEA